MFEQQIQQLQQELQAVEQGIVEMNSLNLGLDEIVGAKGEKVLAPIGRGIFAKTKLISEELIVDIGGKNLVTKSIPDTKKIIIQQIGKLQDVKEELNNKLKKVGEELEKTVINAQKEHSCKHEKCGEGNCKCEK
jgi:prefoldin alpha subunit